mmetsp:Transcript_16707/g.20071  ORF Transcript_16707/g.20071 Transcript_16707/m.20071 type:complete len:84 (+) Transcript_16707:415-666(+)
MACSNPKLSLKVLEVNMMVVTTAESNVNHWDTFQDIPCSYRLLNWVDEEEESSASASRVTVSSSMVTSSMETRFAVCFECSEC